MLEEEGVDVSDRVSDHELRLKLDLVLSAGGEDR